MTVPGAMLLVFIFYTTFAGGIYFATCTVYEVYLAWALLGSVGEAWASGRCGYLYLLPALDLLAMLPGIICGVSPLV
jgi:hypothetical protein